MDRIRKPTPEFINSYLDKMQSTAYFGAETALEKLFKTFPKNNVFDDVLIKVTCLNSLYRTRIINTYNVAHEIYNLDIDDRMRKKDISVVTDIDNSKPNGRSIYSFATKYCSWHNHEGFPIYDKFAANLLTYYLKAYGTERFFKHQLKEYPLYVSKISELRRIFNLDSIPIKRLDKFLWLYGQEVASH